MEIDVLYYGLQHPISAIIIGVVIVTLIVIRVREKKKETFEKRDN